MAKKKPGKYRDLLKSLDYIDKAEDNDMLQNLLVVPRKDKSYEMPHTYCPTADYINQVDILFLPEDTEDVPALQNIAKKELAAVNAYRKTNKQELAKATDGYKYLLVAVDIATAKIDCEPLKYKYSFIVRDAMKRIYDRKILKLPHVIEVDAGTEFKDEFDAYFTSKNIEVRHKKSGRHRAQAVVEGINSILSKLIQTRQLGQEMHTNETSREWVSEVSKIVTAYNNAYAHDPVGYDELKIKAPILVKANTQSADVLPEGTKVRIQLDNPVDAVSEKRLHGKFRIGDIRYENKIRTITQLYLRPNFPPMYKVDDIDVAYTRKQLQVVKDDEKKPTTKLQKKFVIDKLVDKRKRKGVTEYRVHWQGYTDDQDTWEPELNLLIDVPELVKAYSK